MSPEISCFITPHGFGHATRTIAVLEAVRELIPDLRARLFTTVPETLFTGLALPYTYHRVVTDVGLVQTSAFAADTARTLAALEGLIPFDRRTVTDCAALCRSSRLILCDTSVLGILVGGAAGIPSLLIENFTWDWIYAHLLEQEPGLHRSISYLSEQYAAADYRLQAEPVCCRQTGHLTCPPIARRFKQPVRETVRALGGRGRRIILVSMGGIVARLPFLSRLTAHSDCLFVLAGQRVGGAPAANVTMLTPDDGLYHPDLIRAADLLVCKSGYSTVAECVQTDTPICSVSRPDFAESAVLDTYIKNTMNGRLLDQADFNSGAWLEQLPALLDRQRKQPPPPNGASRAAAFIAARL